MINASLAVQLAHYWINKHQNEKYTIPTINGGNVADIMPLDKYAIGLTNTKWLGRCEMLVKGRITYFLDAAHTVDSMQNCAEWFEKQSFQKPQQKWKVFRILVFNCTMDRDPVPLLSKLFEIGFDLAIFTTNNLGNVKALNSDVSNFTVTTQFEKEICANNSQAWSKLGHNKYIKVSNITEALQAIELESDHLSTTTPSCPVHVLVTGSVHLVGGFIRFIHPDFNNNIRNNGNDKL